MMAVAAAQKNREMFAIKKSYSIEVTISSYCIMVSQRSVVVARWSVWSQNTEKVKVFRKVSKSNSS